MKPLLILSVLANVALAALLFQRAPARQSTPSIVREVRRNPPALVWEKKARRTASVKTYANPWQALAARDWRSLIDLLRAAGCPDETIRDLVVMQLSRSHRELLQASLNRVYAQPEWWRYHDDSADWQAHWREMRHIRLQRDLELTELLGAPLKETMLELSGFLRAAPDTWLNPEKARAYRIMQARFLDELAEAQGYLPGHSGLLTEAQKLKIAELKQRQHAELAQLLSPAELEAHDLRFSEAAQYVLRELPPAKSEAEFRQMVKVAQQAGAEPKPFVNPDPTVSEEDIAKKHAALRTQIIEQLKKALGSEVIAAMEQAQAEEKVREREAEQLKRRAEEISEVTKHAKTAGVDVALVPEFIDRMKPAVEEFNRQIPDTEETEEKRKATEAKAKALFERIAVEVFGERGRELVKQFEQEAKGGK